MFNTTQTLFKTHEIIWCSPAGQLQDVCSKTLYLLLVPSLPLWMGQMEVALFEAPNLPTAQS